MNQEPEIHVGIYSREVLNFSFKGDFHNASGTIFPSGEYSATVTDGKIILKTPTNQSVPGNEFTFHPADGSCFELKQVTIGVNFHWEQNEDQRFNGVLKLIDEEGKVLAINSIRLEEYLRSVISSEMSATSSLQLLKAHAVISRSWLLAQMEKNKNLNSKTESYKTSFESESEIIRWYDREDHSLFDVCADDHCQRYQGVTKIFSEKALQAVDETRGEAVVYAHKICDARFSKCCGGVSEDFRNAWEPKPHPYLTKIIDSPKNTMVQIPDLRIEENAEKWIAGNPGAFCNTTDKQILSQVLPGFDQATTDFFRWKVEYSQEQLAGLIHSRSGFDFGQIIKLEPLQRGYSGRIVKLRIHGTAKTLTVGKELEIRKWLSKSHLYSSAFIVEHIDFEGIVPQKFILRGAGWGHGVGLCQIGAAVMGEKGFTYSQILKHYFKGAEIEKVYK